MVLKKKIFLTPTSNLLVFSWLMQITAVEDSWFQGSAKRDDVVSRKIGLRSAQRLSLIRRPCNGWTMRCDRVQSAECWLGGGGVGPKRHTGETDVKDVKAKKGEETWSTSEQEKGLAGCAPRQDSRGEEKATWVGGGQGVVVCHLGLRRPLLSLTGPPERAREAGHLVAVALPPSLYGTRPRLYGIVAGADTIDFTGRRRRYWNAPVQGLV